MDISQSTGLEAIIASRLDHCSSFLTHFPLSTTHVPFHVFTLHTAVGMISKIKEHDYFSKLLLKKKKRKTLKGFPIALKMKSKINVAYKGLHPIPFFWTPTTLILFHIPYSISGLLSYYGRMQMHQSISLSHQ